MKDARDRRDDAKRHLAEGRDPSAIKQADKARALAADSFEVVAHDWIARHLDTKAASHRDKVVRRLERDVFPYLGRRPVAEITAPDILAVLRRIENRGVLETAHRAQQNIGQVIRYAIATSRAVNDPTQALRGALPTYIPNSHVPAGTLDDGRVGTGRCAGPRRSRSVNSLKALTAIANVTRRRPLVPRMAYERGRALGGSAWLDSPR